MADNFLTIGVDSPLELYTLALGWQMYENIWIVLTNSGLVFLPFIGIVLKNIMEPSQSQKANSASLTSLKRIEIDLLSMLVVVLIAGQPFIPLTADQLKFQKVCVSNDGGETFNTEANDISNDPTAYKHTSFLAVGKQANVPAWWFGVMAFSSGFTFSAKTSLPCMPDIRLYHHQIHTSAITDTRILMALGNFYLQCYAPTSNFAYSSGTGTLAASYFGKNTFEAAIAKEPNGVQSIWPGWRPFFAVTSLSNRFYQGRFTDILTVRTNASGSGVINQPFLTCAEYWDGSTNVIDIATNGPYIGIKQRILDHLNLCRKPDGTLCAAENLPILGSANMTAEEVKQRQFDFAVREAIANTPLIGLGISRLNNAQNPNSYETHNTSTPKEFTDGRREATSQVLSVLGSLWNKLAVYPMVKNMREAAPAAQSFLLLAIYLIIPFGLIFSSYSIRFLVIGALGIFTLKFWSYIFYVAYWIDQKFRTVINIDGAIKNPHWNDNIDFVVTTTYVLLPGLFMAVVAWAGFNVANNLQSAWDKVGGMSSSQALAGASGGNALQNSIKAGARQLGRAFGKKKS